MPRPRTALLGWGVVLLALACQRAPRGAAGDGGAGGAWPADLAAYPGARRLCAGQAPAGALRVAWVTFVTRDDPATVAAFYARAHGGDPGRRPFVVRAAGAVTLAVHPAAAGDYPRCARLPAPGDRTVILVTRAAPRLGAAPGAP